MSSSSSNVQRRMRRVSSSDEYHEPPPVAVNMRVSDLAPRVHSLLESNGGFLPLNAAIEELQPHLNNRHDSNSNDNDEPRVFLEHLITCIRGIRIRNVAGVKVMEWSDEKSSVGPFYPSADWLPALNEKSKQLQIFCREVRGLMKMQPKSQIPFGKFVPAYHSHFGRQCCVYQYGFLKLVDLFEAIPHVIQIIGQQKYLTLTHKEQTKRFASDLMRVLKAQTGRKLNISYLATAFKEYFDRPFSPVDYGVCCLEDVLSDVWEGTVVMNRDTEGRVISVEIPSREKTPEEMTRISYFGREVVEILKRTEKFEMAFSKFIPSYHHFFQRQCRVSSYGCSKLIDLMEAISPQTILISKGSRDGEEDYILLNRRMRNKIISQRIFEILKRNGQLKWTSICDLYQENFGTRLTRQDMPPSILSLLRLRVSSSPRHTTRSSPNRHQLTSVSSASRRSHQHSSSHDSQYTPREKGKNYYKHSKGTIDTSHDDEHYDSPIKILVAPKDYDKETFHQAKDVYEDRNRSSISDDNSSVGGLRKNRLAIRFDLAP